MLMEIVVDWPEYIFRFWKVPTPISVVVATMNNNNLLEQFIDYSDHFLLLVL